MVDRPFLASQKWQEQQWRANREGAHWHILDFEKVFRTKCEKMGIPVFAHSVVRTRDEQTALYVQGVSKAKAGESMHNYGHAIDIIHSTQGWKLSKHQWLLLGHIGKEVAKRIGVKIRWGGDWDMDGIPVLDDPTESFWDAAHWELADREIHGFPYPPKPKGVRVGARPPVKQS